jgi:hypothetical protein
VQPAPAPLGIQQAIRALAVDRVTAEVVRAFDEAGIPCILLKGPSIARWLYPAGGRSYGDTDLLVAPPDFARAGAVLEDRGFAFVLNDWAPAELPPIKSARGYVRPGGKEPPAAVDLHRSLPQLSVSHDALWKAFSAQTETLHVAGVDVRVLRSTALAVHIVLHAVQHGHRHHTGDDLRRLLDVLPPGQWPDVAAMAASVGASEALALGLRLEPNGVRIADSLGLPAPVLEASSWSLPAGPRGVTSLAMLDSEPTWRRKVARARWSIVPSRGRIRYVTGLPPGRPFALAKAYGRWWIELARDLPAAVRYAARWRRSSSSGDY